MGLELNEKPIKASSISDLKKGLIKAIDLGDRAIVATIMDKLNRQGAYECPEMAEARRFMREMN